jgi:hypothetical protein
MGFFDFFKRRRPPAPGAGNLLDQLIDAADRKDFAALGRLCEQNERAILEAFPAWQTVPREIRDDPIARDRYVNGLVTIAQAFEHAGNPSLIARLTGDEDNNPLLAWERDLASAQAMIDRGQAEDAVRLLNAVLERTKEYRGTGVNHFLPRTFGMLGIALYHTGDVAQAITLTRRAKILCEEFGDDDGVRVYSENLRHMSES